MVTCSGGKSPLINKTFNSFGTWNGIFEVTVDTEKSVCRAPGGIQDTPFQTFQPAKRQRMYDICRILKTQLEN